MVQGQFILKNGGSLLKRGELALLLFNFFKVYNFYILKLFYSLQNCVKHLKKNYFLCHHNFMKKRNSKLSKNEPVCICKEGWCVILGQEGVLSMRVGELP